MKRIVLLCVFVLMSRFCRDAVGDKPVIFPHKNEIFLETGTALRIDCYSKEAKLQFSFPEDTFVTPRSEHKILRNGDGNYTFLKSNALFEDSGWYACAAEGIEIDNHFKNLNHAHKDITWIYVFVTSLYHRTFKPFLDQYYSFPKTIIVVAGTSAVIPCRPISPTMLVELWQNFKLVQLNKTIRFDPKIGFIMEQVAFEGGEAFVHCTATKYNWHDDYILRYSAATGPKPTMITYGDQLVLQEGDELKIECYSENKIRFLFPDVTSLSLNSSIQSPYKILTNDDGTSTFLRHSAISNDTGWYGCAGDDISNDIPYYSINYTRKEISWIYLYVNSSVPFISSSLVYNNADLLDEVLVPCRPTSPGVNINLVGIPSYEVNNQSYDGIRFEQKLGFIISPIPPTGSVFYCATDEPVQKVSRDYTITYQESPHPRPAISHTDDSTSDNELIIHMSGDEFQMICEASSFETLLHLEWIIPDAVSEGRVHYNRTSANLRDHNTQLYLRSKKLIITITNITESDSGEYTCVSQTFGTQYTVSRTVVVFDRNGEQYIKLDKHRDVIKAVGLKGETIRCLVDLEDFPSAKITWYDTAGRTESNEEYNGYRFVKKISKRNRHQVMFEMYDSLMNGGVYQLHADIGNDTVIFNVSLEVQEPAAVLILELKKYFYERGESIDASCAANGSPRPSLTWSFLKYPKFPSPEDATRVYYESSSTQTFINSDLIKSYIQNISIEESGTLTCTACNVVNCSELAKQLFFSASPEPYFTSTNMNQSVTLNMETYTENILVLECFVGGSPRPKVTWFQNNLPLKKDNPQFKFAYGDCELSILYFPTDDGRRFTCRAANEHGTIEKHIDVIFEGKPDSLRSSLVAGAIVLLVIIAVSWLVIYKQYKKASKKRAVDTAFKSGAADRLNPDLPVGDQAELLPYDVKWEYPRELLTLDKTLGSGAFGIVKKASAKSICRGEAVTTVAVKLVRPWATLNFITALTRELKILVYLGKHPNVVNLLGACTKDVSYGELFVIVEYCQFGNLHDYLLRHRDDFIDEIQPENDEVAGASVDGDRVDMVVEEQNPNEVDDKRSSIREDCEKGIESTSTDVAADDEDSNNVPEWRSKYRGDDTVMDSEPISTQDLVYWAWQVSCGMDFLGKRKVVHGDLAARNVLLADKGIVKICDFGLSKALYDEAQYRNKGVDPLPMKWMAIESIKDRVFSYKSDVWSFGIFMWELFTLARTPYPGVRFRNLYQKLNDGYRMGRPVHATQTIYNTMLDCWEAEPNKRPSFRNLADSLGDLIDEGVRTHYQKLSSTYMEVDEDMVEDGKTDPSDTADIPEQAGSGKSVKDAHGQSV